MKLEVSAAGISGSFTGVGKLAPAAPLTIDWVELDEGARTFTRLEFLDFSAQLSTTTTTTTSSFCGVSENVIR
ncbi:MAG TPA: hypothetical protein VFK05_18180 [Polyangiaceae bacterium]|nr:hypothetical protein [Polyangiaceae bacterium]